ncbi:AsmA family protein [Thermodesulfobacteriota bacterium]
MKVSKFFRWFLYVVGGLIASLLLILIFLAFVPISIDLSGHKGMAESAASLALGRPVKVDGKIIIATSLQPFFYLEGLRIGNPKGFQPGDLFKMKTAKIQVRVLPLLRWKVHITEVSAKGVSVSLLEDEKGAVNWASPLPGESEPVTSPQRKQTPAEGKLELESDSLVLAKLLLEDISVEYRRPGMAKPHQFKIEECKGAMHAGKPFTLSIKGNLLNEPYLTTIGVGSLKEFLEKNRSWMNIKMEIAKTRFDFEGAIDLTQVSKVLQLKATVTGDRLDSLNGLLKLDLPPLESYRAGTHLKIQRKRIDLTNFEIQVGESKLAGSMTVDTSGKRPKSTIDLSASLIQLNDFDVDGWSPEKSGAKEPAPGNDTKAAKEEKLPPDGRDGGDLETNELFNPEVLTKFDFQMHVKAEKVLSGTDELGSGSLTAALKEGRVSIDPLQLKIPGGSFFMATSVKPSKEAPEASVRAKMENFDFGVLVRRANPKADMGGMVNLDIDLKSASGSYDELMAKANGYFDFSGRLENLKAGIIDLWAVNLIAAVAAGKDEKPSNINCVIGRWTMKDGLLKSETFLIDTTKIRICGKGQVDFKKESLTLKMAPTPKRPEFFSLATPVEVNGKFADFKIGIQSGGLIGTAINFITSPVTVPLRRLAGDELPEDGNDVCNMPIGPKERSAKRPPGCK